MSAFCLSKLRGYSAQPILHALESYIHPLNDERQNPTEQAGASNQGLKKLGIWDIGDEPVAPVPVPEGGVLPNRNENIELLSQDSGIRGCWFRCKVLSSLQKRLKVQYYVIDDVEGPGKLEVLQTSKATFYSLNGQCKLCATVV